MSEGDFKPMKRDPKFLVKRAFLVRIICTWYFIHILFFLSNKEIPSSPNHRAWNKRAWYTLTTIVTGWAALPVTWPILDRFPYTSVAITTTSTCFLEPVTSSGHLGPFHLSDESMLHALTCVFSHYCQLFPGFHCHIIKFVTCASFTAFSSHSKSPVGSLHLYFASAFLCTGLFASLLRVTHLSQVLESQLPWAHPEFAYHV